MLRKLLRDRPLAVAFAIAWAVALLPIWWPQLLPLTDGPDHLAAIADWHRLGDARFGLDRFYAVKHGLGPNGGYYLFAHLAAYLLPIGAASKLFLSLYAGALPASVWALARRFDRSPALCLLVFPLVWSHPIGYGLIGTQAGWPALLFALVLLDRFLESPSLERFSQFSAGALATLLFHPLPHLLLLACALPILLAHAARDRRALRAVAAAAGALAATAAISFLALRHAAPVPLTVDGTSETLLETAAQIPHRILIGWPGDADDYAMCALALSFVLLAATARSDERRAAATLRGWVPELCFLVAGAAYVLLPSTLTRPFPVDHFAERLLIPAALFGALLPRGPIAGRRRWLLAPAFAAALVYPILLATHFADFDSRARPAVRLLERVPRGASTLTLLVGGAEDPALDAEVAPYAAFHAYAQVVAGGYDPYRADFGAPLRALPVALPPSPPRDRPTALTPAIAAAYDFLLTRGEARDGQLLAGAHPLARDGVWRLYATRSAR